MSSRCVTLAIFAALGSNAGARQSTPNFGDSPVPDFIAVLSFLSLDDSIAGARFRVHNGDEFTADTEFSTLKLPWSDDFDVGSEIGTLYVEAAIGFLQAEDRFSLPTDAGEVRLDQDWKALAGKVGLGWTFPVGEHWKLRPSLGLALTRVENDASYSPLAEELLKPVLDGVFVNWEAWAVTTALSMTVLHERRFDELEVSVAGRYTYAYTDVFDATDPFQERADSSQFISLRADSEAPTPWELSERPINWTLFASFATFLETDKDALGFERLFEVGAGFRFPLPKVLDSVMLTGALIFGPDISGSAIRLSFSL